MQIKNAITGPTTGIISNTAEIKPSNKAYSFCKINKPIVTIIPTLAIVIIWAIT